MMMGGGSGATDPAGPLRIERSSQHGPPCPRPRASTSGHLSLTQECMFPARAKDGILPQEAIVCSWNAVSEHVLSLVGHLTSVRQPTQGYS